MVAGGTWTVTVEKSEVTTVLTTKGFLESVTVGPPVVTVVVSVTVPEKLLMLVAFRVRLVSVSPCESVSAGGEASGSSV